MDVLKKTHPDLYATLNAQLKDFTDEQKGKAAGLIIEYVLKSGGDYRIFEDPLMIDEIEETF